MKVLTFIGLSLLLCLTIKPSLAEDNAADAAAEGAPAVMQRAIYLPLKPPFVVNYGGKGRLKYLKTEMSVRVKDSIAANAVRHHMPLIRNGIVLLLSSQTDADIEGQEGKELLRQNALEVVRDVVNTEELDGAQGDAGILDLFFVTFVVQS